MKEEFRKELIQSGFLHKPLPLYEEGRLDTGLLKRKILERRPIWAADIYPKLHHSGEGRISIEKEDGAQAVKLMGAPITYCWPEAMSADGDCAFYGTVHAKIEFEYENWENFHCLVFDVKPVCEGVRSVNLNLGIRNEGKVKVPDEYYREGTHVVNLKNGEWNQCIWEFGSMGRDAVTELDFNCRLNGKDTASGDEVVFYIKNVYLDKVTEPEPDKGWLCRAEKISYSSSGYFRTGRKFAVTARKAEEFQLLDADTLEIIYEGRVRQQAFQGEAYFILDFSEITKEGTYLLRCDGLETRPFPISENAFEEALWKVINFIFCERCGYPVPGKHGICHQDVVAKHNGTLLSFGGGWHDAGDMSQQLIHTAEVTLALLEMADALEQNKNSKENRTEQDIFGTLLPERLIEEAMWGLEFVLKSRFGDGYRATSAGVVRWTNNHIGDEDDVEVRCHNHAFENLLCSGICAIASKLLADRDKELAWKCLQVAKEDYTFGINRFEEVGMELPIMWEHTYSSSKSQYYSLIVWTSSVLFEQTRDEVYAGKAAEYGERLLSCQEQETKAGTFTGFFYRDESRKEIVHYSHQSREYMFAEALERLCRSQPEHRDLPKWEQGIRLYGEYLKQLMEYASPYHMIPAGLYHESEAEYEETFRIMHLLVDYDEQKDNYQKQLKAGVELKDGYYVRNFPVWFSFRGNTAIHLAMGNGAAIAGAYLKDKELLSLAKEQLYWIGGRNPFHQSLMYGEGERYAQQYAVMPGEMTGELPVGIQTNENEDIPYWPHNNNATYKEVWTSSACRWLWLLARIYQNER